MTCAYPVTWIADGDEMMRTRFSSVFRVLVALAVFLGPAARQAEALKFRFVLAVYSEDAGTAFHQPEGVTCGEAGNFVAADSGNARLVRYRFAPDSGAATSEVLLDPSLTYPEKIMANSKGELFVFDRKQRRIFHLTADGHLLGSVEPEQMPAPTNWIPRSFTLDQDGNLYLLDVLNERILVLNARGIYQRQLPFPVGSGFISDLAVDFKGALILLDGTGGRVYTAAKGSANISLLVENLQEYLRLATHIALDDRGRIYLSDHNGGRVVVLGQDGSFLGRISDRGWKEGLLNYPSQICINRSGQLFVADTLNSRIQVFEVSD
jgi:sugar lactone lactonase YvrE